MQAILLDIEGTTTPIDFVHKVLFPFARNKVREFVRSHSLEIQPEIAQLRGEHAEDYKNGDYREIFDESYDVSVSAYLRFLIDIDRKSTPLKSIQGKIWQTGYESGELVSQVFDDVPIAFERWSNAGKLVAIYSSGSILAQQLIFKYSNHGDLTRWIAQYFDTGIGHKRETDSYRNISDTLELKSEDIVFVSDIAEELDAARDAGIRTALIIRKGNAEFDGEPGHRRIVSFDELGV
ncbi:MAG: acireductone synthase [Saprospiraceae bacterium]|nr:acireductone synthase [Pyrinomonadaceae bacterium]